MRASGNGLKQVCVQNLLATVRGEVCFDRLRGLSAEIVDQPGADAAAEAQQDAAWMLRTYEPRANVESIEVTRASEAEGDFRVTANIT